MCGRFAQYQSMADYLEELGSDQPLISGFDNVPINRYNVAPSTRVQLLHSAEGNTVISPVKWGWAPHWAKSNMPAPINARIEKVSTGKFFQQIWPHRAVVPADGWYEWVKDETNPRQKQPYFIRLRSKAPLFFAAIGHYPKGNEALAEDGGFVIITADAEGGMVDVHTRRPVVLAPKDACQWLDSGLSSQDAEQLLLQHSRLPDDFEWYPVDKAVGNVRNDAPMLIEATD